MGCLTAPTRTLLRNRAPRADRCIKRVGRSNAEADFADPTEKRLQRDANLRVEIATKKLHSQWVKDLDVLVEPILGEVVIPINDIHHDGPPGDNVAMLAFLVKADKAANDIGTESEQD